jgi:predicted PurR-regulated permease PerM
LRAERTQHALHGTRNVARAEEVAATTSIDAIAGRPVVRPSSTTTDSGASAPTLSDARPADAAEEAATRSVVEAEAARIAAADAANAEASALAAADAARSVAPHRHHPLAPKHYLWLVGAALVIFFALRWLGPVLTPFLIGAIFAYLGTPVVDRAEKRGIPRAASTLFVILLIGVLLAALFLVLIPLVQSEVGSISRRAPDLFAQLTARLAPIVEEKFGVTLALDFESIRDFVTENAQEARDLSARLLSGVKAGGRIVLTLLVNLALIPVVMFYLLRDWKMILDRVDDLLPRRWQPKVRTIGREIDSVLGEFLHGQLLVMVALAVYYSIALSVVRLDHALSIGILTGLLVFIPYVGFGLGFLLGMMAALLQWHGWPAFLAVVAVYGIGQLLENYVLVPFMVGDRIGLHPLAVIFALLAFGELFGFAGVLMALPVSAALLVGLRHLRRAYVASPVYQDEPD